MEYFYNPQRSSYFLTYRFYRLTVVEGKTVNIMILVLIASVAAHILMYYGEGEPVIWSVSLFYLSQESFSKFGISGKDDQMEAKLSVIESF